MAEVTDGRRKRTAVALVGAAGVLVVTEVIGAWCARSGGLRLPAQLFHHPLLFGCAAPAALICAVFTAVRNPVVRFLAGLVAVAVALTVVPVYLMFGSGAEQTLNAAAPGRSDRRLVVEEGAAVIDPVWRVYVDEGSWLTKRRWRVAYLNGDAADGWLTDASWSGADRIRLVTGEGEDRRVHVIDLSDDGRPARTVSIGR
ncbi:hypothetical protein OHS70_07130 [Streptomyces sp. NBC_00390]|uniref:hypothetical protein n=1 Tax=Streptomyces sp. NBC_00390 TaxID=2975736 RepID=UPI002E20A42E